MFVVFRLISNSIFHYRLIPDLCMTTNCSDIFHSLWPMDIAQHFFKGTMSCIIMKDSGMEFCQRCTYKQHLWRTGVVSDVLSVYHYNMRLWDLSLHLCIQLEADIVGMCKKDIKPLTAPHREQMKSRIAVDDRDWKFIRKKLTLCTDHLNSVSVSNCLVNTVSAPVEPVTANVYNAMKLGRIQMSTF